jgi:hypothetical protein
VKGAARFFAAISYSGALLVQSVLAIPHLINLEGRLTDPNGNPIQSSTQVEFRLYHGGGANAADAGTVLYKEISSITPSSDGTYTHLLGSGSALEGLQLTSSAFNTDQEVYLQLNINNQAVLPRLRIVSEASALVAETVVDNAITTTKIADGNVTKAKLAADVQGTIPPGPHAATHRTGGSDSVQLTPTQIDGTALVSQSTGDQILNGNLTVTGTLNGAQTNTVKLSNSSVYLSTWQSTSDPTKIDSAKILGTVPPGPHSANHRQGGGDAVQLVPSQIDGTALVAQPISDQTLQGNLAISQNLTVSGEDVQSHLIPTGMIAMFDQSCPSGWSRFSALDARFPQGSSSYGQTGGAATHSHTVNPHTHSISTDGAHQHATVQLNDGGGRDGAANNGSYPFGQRSISGPVTVNDAGGNTSSYSSPQAALTSSDGSHNHGGQTGSASPGTDSQSNIPPYLNVVWCKKN